MCLHICTVLKFSLFKKMQSHVSPTNYDFKKKKKLRISNILLYNLVLFILRE